MTIGRSRTRALAVVLLTATAAGCMAPRVAPSSPARSRPTSSVVSPAPVSGRPRCVPVRHWRKSRLAAQTIVVPATETAVASVSSEVSRGAGGVILFGSVAPADLGRRLAALRRTAPAHLGLLVMTDEEGGGVQRMANLVGSLPWARHMGRHWSRARIRTRVARVARRMAALGVNTDLAPVVDVDGRSVVPGPADADGLRSFSGRTPVVTRDGLAYARGLLRGGVIPVLKHFPGLGHASRNTDYGTAHTLPWRRLKRVGLPPFIAGIRAGVPAIMVSNAIVPGLTHRPASLSPAAIRGELARKLHFSGLIVTDSLTAGAVSQAGFGVPRAAVQAIRSGADMVLYSAATAGAARRTFRAVIAAETRAVARGTLPRHRLVAAAEAALTARHVHVC
ncbi:MAG TPA: glycoside hydrolase family 3 N-terminal domain-containing protein [Jatrophihabitans sp.]|nr:glycoside hydrolase family 3 N-terminal domain-containing protein [Jatrophihabitans sp.]